MGSTKPERLTAANEMLRVIAANGREFFARQGRVSRFELDTRGVLWFVDKHSEKRIYTAYRYEWRHFTEGGTLRSLVEALAAFIRTGAPIDPRHFGPWPKYLCGGDLWGYGDSMEGVRAASVDLGVCVPRAAAATAQLPATPPVAKGGESR